MDATKVYSLSSLSEASYADFRKARKSDGTYKKSKVIAALTKEGFSPTQAADFVAQWRVVDHQPDTASGFSATLFERTDANGNGTGEYVFANRGTAGFFSDILVADVFGIVLQGKATWQLVDMYRYFRRLETPAGQPVVYTQDELSLLKGFATTPGLDLDLLALEAGFLSDTGIGALNSGTNVFVTGHSLGGHLATWFPAFFGSRARHVYTYNGAGIGGFGVEIFDLLTRKFRDGKMFRLTNDQITNIYAEAGLEVTAGTGAYVGNLQPVFIEDQGPVRGNLLIANHSIALLTDSLAVYALLDNLDPGQPASGLSLLLDGSSNNPQDTLEATLNALSTLFDAGSTITKIDDREQLYQRIHAIRAKLFIDPLAADPTLQPQYQGLQLVPLIHEDAAALTSLAHDDIAYRYALDQLNPFAVLGAPDLYTAHNADGHLNADHFSDQFLADRARFLSQALQGNRADSHYVLDSPYRNEAYQDLETGRRYATADALKDPHHYAISQWPEQADRLIFGSHAGDEIQGGNHDDHLYGMAGDDVLQGNGGNNYLEGGKGNDLYKTTPTDGLNTIFDSDGQGRIVIDGDLLIGGNSIADGLWQSADGRHHYALDGDTLYIDGRIRVERFRPGDLGITLSDQGLPLPNPSFLLPGTSITDTLLWDDVWPGIPPDKAFVATGGKGNDLIGTISGHDYITGGDGNDLVVSGDGDDHIVGGTGSDLLFTGRGADAADGGAGSDLILDARFRRFNSSGDELTDSRIWRDLDGPFTFNIPQEIYTDNNGELFTTYTLGLPQQPHSGSSDGLGFSYAPIDASHGSIAYGLNRRYDIFFDSFPSQDTAPNWFSGGSGDDFIFGNDGADTLLGGADGDWLSGLAGNDLLLGGSGEDYLLGQQGADLLSGGNDDDELYGGSGTDTLYGGTGDDILTGDSEQADRGDNDKLYGETGNDTLNGNGGNDLLRGGSGNDVLYGQQGNDWLEGGSERDFLYGGSGTDTLFGGTGSDWLQGDAGNDRLYGGAGSDQLQGGDGDDRLDGGADGVSDKLTGGAGADDFIYHPGSGRDIITDSEQADRVILRDILPGDIRTSVAHSTDGKTLLALALDADNILYIEDGLADGPGTFEFGDGTGLSRTDLIARSLETPIDYRLNQAGTLGGGTGDDILAGSMGNDTLLGQAGNDTLAGSGGDDLLAGGDGTDRYLVGPGTGFDIIDEATGQASELELLPGVDLAQLNYQRSGDDLRIRLPGGSDGAMLRGFFTRNPVWSIRDASGAQRILTPQSVNGALQPVDTDASYNARRAAFIDNIQSTYGNVLRLQGYRLEGDGKWHAEFPWGNTVQQRRTTHNRYSVGFNLVSDAPAGDYTRTLEQISETLLGQHSAWQASTITTYSPGGTRMQGGPGTGSYIDLDRLAQSGASGTTISGNAVPVYGNQPVYNPLSGRMEATVSGYMLYPGSNGSAATSTLQEWHYYKELDKRVNVLDLTLDSGDNRFDIQQGFNWGFNLVDGGAGNDWLDARQGREQWKRNPESIPLPQSGYWSGSTLPGSLLYGNDGDDRLYGSDGADELIGGTGNDYMQGGIGNDTYRVGATSGMDVIFEDGHLASSSDRLILPQGINPGDVQYTWGRQLADNLDPSDPWPERMRSLHTTFTIQWGAQDGVTLVLPHSDQQAGLGIESVVFGNGQEFSLSSLMQQTGGLGTSDPHLGDNVLQGNRYLHGYAGNDTLIADYTGEPVRIGSFLSYDAILIGGAGRDRLLGGAGNDLLLGNDIVADYSLDFRRPVTGPWDEGNEYDGGQGNDEIWTTAGNDLIRFGTGDGQDTVHNTLPDPTALSDEHRAQLSNGIDILRFKAGISPEDIHLSRAAGVFSAPLGEGLPNVGAATDLTFTLANTTDTITFAHWFDAGIKQLKQVEFADGSYWNRDDIDSLLNGGTYAHRMLSSDKPGAGDQPPSGPGTAPMGTSSPSNDATPAELIEYYRRQLEGATATSQEPMQGKRLAGGSRAAGLSLKSQALPSTWNAVTQRREEHPPRTGQTAPLSSSENEKPLENAAHTVPGGHRKIRQQWGRMQRAIGQLDSGQHLLMADARYRHGTDPGMNTAAFKAHRRTAPLGEDPISLRPGDTRLRPFGGLAEGIQQLPW